MLRLLFCFASFIFFITGTIAQNSDSAGYYFQKGIAEKVAGRFREAEKNFIKAHEYDNQRTDIIIELGNAYLAQNQYAKAREQFLQAEQKDPDNKAVIENLATLSFNLRKWDDAIKYAQKMKQLKSEKPVSYIIGKSYYEQENYGEAVKFLNTAMTEEPAKGEIPYAIARAYLEMSNYKLSAQYFEKAIAVDSSKVNWIYEAGLVFYAIPDYKKSLQYIELAGAKGYKRSNDYLENLASAYLNVNQFEKAIPIFQEVLQRKPSDQELLYQMAQANYKAGKYQEAIDYWDKCLEIDKTNARALYMIGLSYQKKGDKKKGMQLCDKAIEMDPSLNSLRQKQGDFGM